MKNILSFRLFDYCIKSRLVIFEHIINITKYFLCIFAPITTNIRNFIQNTFTLSNFLLYLSLFQFECSCIHVLDLSQFYHILFEVLDILLLFGIEVVAIALGLVLITTFDYHFYCGIAIHRILPKTKNYTNKTQNLNFFKKPISPKKPTLKKPPLPSPCTQR